MAQYNYEANRWKDRVSPDAAKRKLTITDDTSGTIAINAVLTANIERADTPSQEGTAFNATNMNDLEARINSAISPCLVYSYLKSFNSNVNLYLSSAARDYPLLEIFYGDPDGNDGVTSQKIYIGDSSNYNNDNYISLDSISCGIGSNDKFYFKTATYNIKNEGNRVRITRINNRTKRLVFDNGNFNVQDYNSVDLYIYYVIGYKT